MNKTQKTVLWLSVAILVITILYTTGLPHLKKETIVIDDTEVAQAIQDYANTQMPRKRIEVPARAEQYKVEEVKVHEVSELPGPHHRRRIKCTLNGGYQMPGSHGKEGAGYSFSQKNHFIISDRYPYGISVQLDD